METLLARPALQFSGEHHDVADLVLTGLLTGRWQALEARTAIGLGLEAEVTEQVSPEELSSALTRFRYERRLIAASELRDWLSERSLATADLYGVLRRRLLRERPAIVGGSPASAVEVAAVIRAESICAGTLAEGARELLAWHAGEDGLAELEARSASPGAHPADRRPVDDLVAVALADGPSRLETLGPAELLSRATRLCAVHAAYESFCDSAVSDGAIDARLAERRRDWTVVSGSELSFELEGAARETRLRVVHDGGTLGQIAGSLGLEPVHRVVEFGTAPAELSSELLSAGKGQLIGPWNEGQRWRVLEVEGRFEPGSSADGRVRAREELLTELLERLATGKAGMLGPL